jgi:ABC-type dipeptide/oligopeptide/nickel transport system permease subunit
MFMRFMRSRGWGKLRRNRLALASLLVIGLYGLLGLGIALAQALHWVGRETQTFSLRGTVAGMFLPVETLARVGPEKLAGFGLKQDAELRVVQYGWYIDELGRALTDIDRLPSESTTTTAEILARAAIAERRLAPLPLQSLRDLHARGLELLSQRDALSVRMTLLRKIEIQADAMSRSAQVLRSLKEAPSVDLERFAKLRDDLAYALEDVVFAAQDYADLDPDEGIADFDLDPLADAADSLRDAQAPEDLPDPLYPRELIQQLKAAAVAEAHEVADELAAVVALITPVVEDIYPMPTGASGLIYKFKILLGTDRQGRSIMVRGLYSAKVAIQVGFVTAMISVLIGSILGAAAAFLGGWVDHTVNWLFSVLSSIPHLVLLVVIAFMFTGSRVDGTLIPVYAAFCLTFWIGPCRVVRGEAMKLKELEFVQAATAIGFGRGYILLKHLIPNTLHLMFISFSLLFIAAIKSEVILTFLGLGLKDGASWGIMISQSKPEVVSGFFWQIGAATFFMFVLVLAFNILSDALQDAFDPKHVG